MCGRTACSRNSDGIRCACAYKPRGKDKQKPVKPLWLETSQKYYPSYNISPQTHTPVLLSSRHAHITSLLASPPDTPSPGPVSERVLQVMKWGLVPGWYQGEPGKFPTLLNNCRCEGMLEKPSYRSAVQKKQRCVVLADGFFEWNRATSHKQPYFIHFADTSPTAEMLEVGKSETELLKTEATASEREDFNDVSSGRLLTMAGLFDIWKGAEHGDPLYTYTIITLDAHHDFAHIHDRMPAILDGDEAIVKWLDPSVPTNELVAMLQPSSALAWFPVSNVVNNVKHKSVECVQRIDPRVQVSRKQNTLLKWFAPKTQATPASSEGKKEGEELTSPEAKRAKLD